MDVSDQILEIEQFPGFEEFSIQVDAGLKSWQRIPTPNASNSQILDLSRTNLLHAKDPKETIGELTPRATAIT